MPQRTSPVEPAGAGLSALAELSTPRSQRGLGRTSGAPIDPVKGADSVWAVMLSESDRFCYHFRRLGGVIWEIPAPTGTETTQWRCATTP